MSDAATEDVTTTIDRYGVMGYPVSHSRSPVIHKLFALQTQQNLQYELLQKSAKNEVQVSDTAVSILHPDNLAERAEALRHAAFAPRLFSELRDRFPEGVPSEQNLRSHLVKQGFSDRAIGPAINAYLQTCEFVQQSEAYESYGRESPVGVESEPDQSVGAHKTMRPTEVRSQKLAGHGPAQPDNPVLNRINFDASGGIVLLSGRFDSRGLEKLEKKIKVLQELIADEEPEDDGGSGENESSE